MKETDCEEMKTKELGEGSWLLDWPGLFDVKHK